MSSINSDEPSDDQNVNEGQDQSTTWSEVLPSQDSEESASNEIEASHNILETTLIKAVQQLIQLGGSAFSVGAIRDLGDLKENSFDPKAAVSALTNLGYKHGDF